MFTTCQAQHFSSKGNQWLPGGTLIGKAEEARISLVTPLYIVADWPENYLFSPPPYLSLSLLLRINRRPSSRSSLAPGHFFLLFIKEKKKKNKTRRNPVSCRTVCAHGFWLPKPCAYFGKSNAHKATSSSDDDDGWQIPIPRGLSILRKSPNCV